MLRAYSAIRRWAMATFKGQPLSYASISVSTGGTMGALLIVDHIQESVECMPTAVRWCCTFITDTTWLRKQQARACRSVGDGDGGGRM